MLKCLAKGRLGDDDFDEDAARFGTPGMLLSARDVAGPRVSGRSYEPERTIVLELLPSSANMGTNRTRHL